MHVVESLSLSNQTMHFQSSGKNFRKKLTLYLCRFSIQGCPKLLIMAEICNAFGISVFNKKGSECVFFFPKFYHPFLHLALVQNQLAIANIYLLSKT